MHFRCLNYYYLAALQYYIDVAYCHRWSNVVSLYVSRSVCHDCNNNKQQQPFYGPLSGTTWVSRTRVSQYQKKHSPTHHPDHHPIFISFFHLLPSIASSLFNYVHGNLFAQPLSMSSGLPLGLEPTTSYSIHFFTQSVSSFLFAHTIATCFAVVSILYHLFLVFVLTPYLELCLLP